MSDERVEMQWRRILLHPRVKRLLEGCELSEVEMQRVKDVMAEKIQRAAQRAIVEAMK